MEKKSLSSLSTFCKISRMPDASRLLASKERLLGFAPNASSFFPLFIHRKYEDISDDPPLYPSPLDPSLIRITASEASPRGLRMSTRTGRGGSSVNFLITGTRFFLHKTRHVPRQCGEAGEGAIADRSTKALPSFPPSAPRHAFEARNN